MKTAYKFLRKGMKSNRDGSKWVMGEWRTVPAPTEACVGLNCSKLIMDALSYVQGETFAKVEYGGKVIDSGDKLTCEKMRVVNTWEWDKMMSVKIAVYAARLVLPVFENKNPDDKRPRLAIEAAEAWIKKPTKKNSSAAYAAYAAYAASAYAAAYDSAAYAAYAAASAAYAAYSAAYSAAYYAASAASAAHAYSAAAYAVKRRIQRYILSLLDAKEAEE